MANPGRSDSFGLSWADQWDYKGQDEQREVGESNPSKSKMAGYNDKVKEAAGTGFVKAKTAATFGARKVKAGTVSGVNWVKSRLTKSKS